MEANTALLSIRQRVHRIPIDLKFPSKVKAVLGEEMKRASRSLPRSEYAKLCNLLRQELNALVVAWKAEGVAQIPALLRNPDHFMAKLVSQDLKRFDKFIRDAAQRGRREFFIELGKCLSGEVKTDVWNRREFTLASIIAQNPSMTARDMMRELKKFGWTYTEETAVRMQIHRLVHDIEAAGEALGDLAEQYARSAKA